MTTCFLAPDPVQSTFFIPGGNTPGNGSQVFFYVAGTVSTKTTVYKDNAAATPWTNPIVLDSGGNLPSGGEVWIPTGIKVKVVWAPSTDSDPPSSPYRTMDNMAGVNDVSTSGSEWNTGPTPTFISPTSFSVTGDQRATFSVGRRIFTTNTGGTVYSTILTSTFGGGITTLTLVNDSGSLDAGLSAVSTAVLGSVNESVPVLNSISTYFADSSDPTKRMTFSTASISTGTLVTIPISNSGFEDSPTSTITASSSINLDSVSSKYVQISGTTAVSSFILSNGRTRWVEFASNTPLTTTATFILPGGRNVTTAVGDTASLRGEAGGVVRMTVYEPAVMGPGSPMGALLAATTFASTSFTSTISTVTFQLTPGFNEYRITVQNAMPVSSAASDVFAMRFSVDGGVTAVSSAAYNGAMSAKGIDGVAYDFASAGNGFMFFNNTTTNSLSSSGTRGGWSGNINIHNPANLGSNRMIDFAGCYGGSATIGTNLVGMAMCTTGGSAFNAVILQMINANMSSGAFYLYGLRPSF